MDHLDTETGTYRGRPLFNLVTMASAVEGLQWEVIIQRVSVESFLYRNPHWYASNARFHESHPKCSVIVLSSKLSSRIKDGMALRGGAPEGAQAVGFLLSQLGQGIHDLKGFQEVLESSLKTIRGSIVRSLSRAFAPKS